MSVEVKKIQINIDDKIIELTPGQARELKCVLNDMYRDSYIPAWPVPIVIEQPQPYRWYPGIQPWRTTDGGNTAVLQLNATGYLNAGSI